MVLEVVSGVDQHIASPRIRRPSPTSGLSAEIRPCPTAARRSAACPRAAPPRGRGRCPRTLRTGRGDAEPPRRFEEHVGLGLVPRRVLGGHHRLEPVADRSRSSVLRPRRGSRRSPPPSAGARGRQLAIATTGTIGCERLEVLAGSSRSFSCTIASTSATTDTRVGGEHADDLRRRHAAHRVEAWLGERDPVRFEHRHPGAVVGRHRVGERAVAVEDQAGDAGRGGPRQMVHVLRTLRRAHRW
jgi:hypothetical protein